MATRGLLLGTRFNNLPEVLQTKSLLFDGVTSMHTPPTVAPTVGIANVWSLAIWAKNDAVTMSSDPLLAIRGGASANRIRVFAAGATDNLTVNVFNSVSLVMRNFTWDDVIEHNTDTWVHYVITFGGDQGNGANGLKLWTQGVDAGPGDGLDNPGSMTDTQRGCELGTDAGAPFWRGPVYSFAVYNTVLNEDNIVAMYNGGNARDFDLEKDFGGYTASANVRHYFRLGIGTTEADFGLDRVTPVSDLSMEAEAGDIDITDLTDDIPL